MSSGPPPFVLCGGALLHASCKSPLSLHCCRRHDCRRVKSGRGNGTIGLLTSGLLTRQSYYEHAALCALVPLINPQLYPGFALAAGSE